MFENTENKRYAFNFMTYPGKIIITAYLNGKRQMYMIEIENLWYEEDVKVSFLYNDRVHVFVPDENYPGMLWKYDSL